MVAEAEVEEDPPRSHRGSAEEPVAEADEATDSTEEAPAEESDEDADKA